MKKIPTYNDNKQVPECPFGKVYPNGEIIKVGEPSCFRCKNNKGIEKIYIKCIGDEE
jgi:hypothetical protein